MDEGVDPPIEARIIAYHFYEFGLHPVAGFYIKDEAHWFAEGHGPEEALASATVDDTSRGDGPTQQPPGGHE